MDVHLISVTVLICDDKFSLYYSNHADSRFSREERGSGKISDICSCETFQFDRALCSLTLMRVLSFAVLAQGDRGTPGAEGARGEKGDTGQRGEKVSNQEMMMMLRKIWNCLCVRDTSTQSVICLNDIFFCVRGLQGQEGQLLDLKESRGRE